MVFAKKLRNTLFTALTLSLCFQSTMMANEESSNKFVIGAYVGGSMLQQSSEFYLNNFIDLPGDYEKMLFGLSYGAKLGYDVYFLPRHGLRIYADYMNSALDSKDRIVGKYTIHTIGLNADYKFEIVGGLGVFAGAGLVYNIMNTQYLGNFQAFGGSINAGLAYNISFVEIEFRLRYLIYNTQDRFSNYLPTIGNITPTTHLVDLDSPITFHLGVNFRF